MVAVAVPSDISRIGMQGTHGAVEHLAWYMLLAAGPLLWLKRHVEEGVIIAEHENSMI
jgi:hypothetical protein